MIVQSLKGIDLLSQDQDIIWGTYFSHPRPAQIRLRTVNGQVRELDSRHFLIVADFPQVIASISSEEKSFEDQRSTLAVNERRRSFTQHQIPRMTVQEARHWKHQRKNGDGSAQLPQSHYLNDLKYRDIVRTSLDMHECYSCF